MASKFSIGKEYPEPRVDEVINRFNVDNPLQFKSELISNGYLKISASGNRYFLLKKSPTPEEMEKFVAMDKEREEVERTEKAFYDSVASEGDVKMPEKMHVPLWTRFIVSLKDIFGL
jgi:hypothetical protein